MHEGCGNLHGPLIELAVARNLPADATGRTRPGSVAARFVGIGFVGTGFTEISLKRHASCWTVTMGLHGGFEHETHMGGLHIKRIGGQLTQIGHDQAIRSRSQLMSAACAGGSPGVSTTAGAPELTTTSTMPSGSACPRPRLA